MLRPHLPLLLFLFLLGCQCEQQKSSATLTSANKNQASAKRGRTIYITQCATCHHSDPKKAGPLGPEVFASSRELLAERILHAKYPVGYQPKRSSHAMAALPHLKNEIESLYLFLNTSE